MNTLPHSPRSWASGQTNAVHMKPAVGLPYRFSALLIRQIHATCMAAVLQESANLTPVCVESWVYYFSLLRSYACRPCWLAFCQLFRRRAVLAGARLPPATTPAEPLEFGHPHKPYSTPPLQQTSPSPHRAVAGWCSRMLSLVRL